MRFSFFFFFFFYFIFFFFYEGMDDVLIVKHIFYKVNGVMLVER